ncbi:DUF2007 domain-containing protein [uncultured Duncaniella sp.]|uniref:putative signal transducing protein n=1 Tax=uncultured Duncaniella sp. TaxID=2768039 RepID=UPI0025FFCCF1|nr:DUF2007 domain-containing protein [uncultured Duncaniella sp.]
MTCVAEFDNQVEASIAKGMLESHSIPAIVDNGTILSVLPMPLTIGGARLMVNDSQASEAIDLLNRHGDR